MPDLPNADRPARRRSLELRTAACLIAALALACVQTDREAGDESGGTTMLASFGQDRTDGPPGMVVQFSDTSSGVVTSHEWDFGDSGTSTAQNPTHPFANIGTYTVSLTVSGPDGTSTVQKNQLIGVHPAVSADFDCTLSTVTVSCTDKSENATHWEWRFGDGKTSSVRNPTHSYTANGSFDIVLVASGPGGSASASMTVDVVFPPVVASFSCDVSAGFAPLTVTCTDESEYATSWDWDFGDGATSTEPNPAHQFTTDGPFDILLTATGPSGSDTHSTAIKVGVLEIFADVTAGTAPLEVNFMALTKDVPTNLLAWSADGEHLGLGFALKHVFYKTGTYTVELLAGNLMPAIIATTQVVIDVGYAEASADFFPSPADGPGPLQVQMIDTSPGAVEKWEWNFGDEKRCVFPAPPPGEPNPPDTCDSSSPFHVYETLRSYDVTLTVTGPDENGDLITSTSDPEQVLVYILDASFEEQTTGQPISGAWESLRPKTPTEEAEHLALSATQGSDTGFPSDGQKWAVLDGLGTDGSPVVADVENGIRQDFICPPGRPVLEFDYALLYSEPPAGPSSDGTRSRVRYDTTKVEIPSSWADVATPYAGRSTRYPTRDGGMVRATPIQTASINLDQHCGDPAELKHLTLTIRTGNGEDDRRSPRTYVDNVRFVEPVDMNLFPVDFSLDTDPVVAGEVATFVDESCPAPAAGTCLVPSSWRWDFGTHGAVSPPSATGSADQEPTYVFAEPGTFEVRLEAHLADAAGTASKNVEILERPSARFGILGGPHVAPASIEFDNLSTWDPRDPIESWSWDFGGWGSSDQKVQMDPGAVLFPQTGEFLVTLTIRTMSGVSSSFDMSVVVE